MSIDAGHIWHVCQWGFWGKDISETCDEADYMEFVDDNGDPIDEVHETCGWFHFTKSELVEELESVFSDEKA